MNSSKLLGWSEIHQAGRFRDPPLPDQTVVGDHEHTSGAIQKRSSARTPTTACVLPKPSRTAITPAP